MTLIIGAVGIQLVARGPTVEQSAIISALNCMFKLCKYIDYIVAYLSHAGIVETQKPRNTQQ
jgi:hypothetical protein